MVLMIQFLRDSLSVPAVPHLQGTSSLITALLLLGLVAGALRLLQPGL